MNEVECTINAGRRTVTSAPGVWRLPRKTENLFSMLFLCGFAMFSMTSQGESADFTIDNVELSGEIIRGTGSTLMVRLDVGRIINITPNKISLVRIDMQDGSVTEGTLTSWQNGVYVVAVGDTLVHVDDGRVIRTEPFTPPTALVQEAEAPPAELIGAGGPQTDSAADTTRSLSIEPLPFPEPSPVPSPERAAPTEPPSRSPSRAPSSSKITM